MDSGSASSAATGSLLAPLLLWTSEQGVLCDGDGRVQGDDRRALCAARLSAPAGSLPRARGSSLRACIISLIDTLGLSDAPLLDWAGAECAFWNCKTRHQSVSTSAEAEQQRHRTVLTCELFVQASKSLRLAQVVLEMYSPLLSPRSIAKRMKPGVSFKWDSLVLHTSSKASQCSGCRSPALGEDHKVLAPEASDRRHSPLSGTCCLSGKLGLARRAPAPALAGVGAHAVLMCVPAASGLACTVHSLFGKALGQAAGVCRAVDQAELQKNFALVPRLTQPDSCRLAYLCWSLLLLHRRAWRSGGSACSAGPPAARVQAAG